jgi:two-component system, cell cycle sensor histidine kinase and response regulator CckA
MEQMLCHLIREDIELSLQLDPSLHAVKVDPAQIERLIINLVINARDAMPFGGKLTVSTANFDTPATAQTAAASYAILDITDSGVGMDQETLSRIFEPFFTTKEVGKGTGLGLSTAQGIVKQNDGQIEVISQPGKGTTFRILFPSYVSS